MSFITDAELLNAVQDTLRKTNQQMVSAWDSITSAANTQAYNEIVTILGSRGFDPTQINTWDRGPEMNRRLGIFWSIVNGGALVEPDTYSANFIKVFDVREELCKVSVTIGGQFVYPNQVQGNPNWGAYDTDQTFFGKFPVEDSAFQEDETNF
jgi:hypothetical protein